MRIHGQGFIICWLCYISYFLGFVEVGESVENATIREVKEETNLDLLR